MHLEYRMTTGRTTELDLAKRIQLPVLDAVHLSRFRRVRNCAHLLYGHTFEKFLMEVNDVVCLWDKDESSKVDAAVINFI